MFRKPSAVVFVSVIIFSIVLARPVDGEQAGPPKLEAGFEQIFNGRDLTGWDGDPAFWSVEDGVIVARVEPSVQVRNHSYLIWQGGNVRDFELRLAMRSTQGNSGIDYRAKRVSVDKDGQPLKWTIQGYQSDIASGWMGSLYNWGKPGAQPGQFVAVSGQDPVSKYVGAVADREELLKAGYYKPGQWNEYAIIARGSHVLHRINGYLVVEFIDSSRDTRREGILGLQVHSGRGPFLNEFRDIRIKQSNIRFGQAKLLFNGNDLSGWNASDNKAKTAWVVKDGVLVGKGRSAGRICTRDGYTNCVLRFQYRRLGSRKGGVLLRLADSDKAQPTCIRVLGKGDDFNRIGALADFPLKLRKRRTNTAEFRAVPEKFWNECEIVLNGGQLEVKVNGVVRATAVRCEQTAGKIGLEPSSDGVQYRNIVVIPIVSGSA